MSGEPTTLTRSNQLDLAQETLPAIQLSLISGIGSRTVQTLVNHFGNLAAVFRASHEELVSLPGVGPKLARKILENRDGSTAQSELERLQQAGVQFLLRGSEEYPTLLDDIPDAPQILYYKGTIEPVDGLAIAIVGSRRCTPYGLGQAHKIAGALARAGVTVVSGLARGIDAAAHRGALETGGRTLAVFATGLGTVYPPEHKDLAEQVSKQGALITESCFDQLPIAGLFPQRNRIISGLSLGVILIEASRKSGALHTARHAMEQGREVFSVPGRIDSIESQGCLDLIRDGATLIRGVEDILDELGPLTKPVQTKHKGEVRQPIELNLNDQETEILNALTSDPKHIDEVLRTVTLDSSRVLSTLTVLEMKNLVRRHPGNYLSRP
ncbi:MAG: DNA-processing protein DprA [Planctomycetaceae bacterium]|nr:DNA-processing protein DprA [Planctomycetaceae bacterium]